MKSALFFKELKKQNLSRLEKSTCLSRQALHGALKNKNMKLQNLEAVAQAMNYQVVMLPSLTQENVLASLKKVGAPVAHSDDGTLDLENAVAASLRWSRKEGLYESLVPYVLACNAEKLNLSKLLGLALQDESAKVLGYFVDMANKFRPNKKLQKLSEFLFEMKEDKTELLVLTEKINFSELFE